MSLPHIPSHSDEPIPLAESIYVVCKLCGGVGRVGTQLSPGVACPNCEGTGTVKRYDNATGSITEERRGAS